jgi:hypothetical protein
MPDEETKTAYREAYEDWQKKLAELHRLLLDGEPIPPIQIKGLLNRESRAKRNYDRARLALLGIDSEEETEEDEANQ